MRTSFLFTLLLLFPAFSFRAAEETKNSPFPLLNLKTLDGNSFSTADIQNEGKPIIVSLWATWCVPCKKELSAIAEVYKSWQAETGVKLVAVCIDDARSLSRVAPMIEANQWPFEFYLDTEHKLKTALQVLSVPYTMLLDGERNIVSSHTSYKEGDEQALFEKIKALTTQN